jgi:hypothetical protein
VSFEFLKGFSNGFLMGIDQMFVAAQHRQDRNRFGR